MEAKYSFTSLKSCGVRRMGKYDLGSRVFSERLP